MKHTSTPSKKYAYSYNNKPAQSRSEGPRTGGSFPRPFPSYPATVRTFRRTVGDRPTEVPRSALRATGKGNFPAACAGGNSEPGMP